MPIYDTSTFCVYTVQNKTKKKKENCKKARIKLLISNISIYS